MGSLGIGIMALETKGFNSMDPLTKEQRRKNMQAIKSKDTSIELLLRKALWHNGIRYRKNYAKLPGKPDIVITKLKIAVFCDSEFWHGFCWEEKKLKISDNRQYWIDKIEKNMARDANVNQLLMEGGWIVLRFWGKDIKRNLSGCLEVIMAAIHQREGKCGTHE